MLHNRRDIIILVKSAKYMQYTKYTKLFENSNANACETL